MSARHLLPLAALACLLTTSLACESTVTGNEGNLQFSYPADDRVFDFNKPIAIGARLDVSVREAGDRSPVMLLEATSADEAVLAVETFADDTFTLLATGDGNVEVSVRAETSSGAELSDSVNLLARTPEVHVLRHTCTADPAAAYLTDQPIYVPFEFTMENEQPVIGYGYYPVSSSSPELVFDATFAGSQYMRFDTLDAASVILSSDITDTTLDLAIVEPGAITGVQQPVAGVIEDIDVGDTNLFFVRSMVGDRVVCQGRTPLTVVSETPDTCAVRVVDPIGTPDAPTDTANEYGWFEVEGVAAGECRYTVTFTDGAAGAGTSDTFTYPIEP